MLHTLPAVASTAQRDGNTARCCWGCLRTRTSNNAEGPAPKTRMAQALASRFPLVHTAGMHMGRDSEAPHPDMTLGCSPMQGLWEGDETPAYYSQYCYQREEWNQVRRPERL